MTNREKTIQRIQNQKEKNMEDKNQYGRISIFDRLELEYLEDIEKDLEVLDILKKYLFIRIEDKPSFNGLYLVALQEDARQICDYTCIFVNEEEKEIIKEWLENANR